MLKNCIVNVNTRVCPTTFVLIPIPKSNDNSEKKSMMQHISRVHHTMRSPKETLFGLLQDKYYIALLCEVCRLPSEDKELWYEIKKPKEIVGKILPLARAGLQFAYVLNKVSSIVRIFGLPVPVLQDSTFTEGIDLLDELRDGTLSNYSELERVVEENYNEGTLSSTSSQSQSSTQSNRNNGLSGGESGYCIREFTMFLSKIDPNKRWSNLSPRVNENGDLCYVCPGCLSQSIQNSTT